MFFLERKYLPRFIKRFIEYFGFEIALSAFASLLFYVELVPQNNSTVFLVPLFIYSLNVVLQFFRIRRSYGRNRNTSAYYKINILIFSLFAIFNIIIAVLNIEPLYTFLFLGFKFAIPFGISKIGSAVLGQIILLMLVFFAPRNVYIVEDEFSEEDYNEITSDYPVE